MATSEPERESGATRAPDPRTARTRAAIAQALVDLLGEGRAEITVREIVTAAGVSRASFYTHFSGVEEVVLDLLSESFDELRELYQRDRSEAGGRTRASIRAGQERLADVFAKHRSLLGPLMKCGLGSAAYAGIVHALSETTVALIYSGLSRVPTGVDPDILALGIANALAGLLTAWVSGEIDVDRDTIVTHLLAILPQWVVEPDLPDAH